MTTTWKEVNDVRLPVDISEEPLEVRQALAALARLLGAAVSTPPRNLSAFVNRHLGTTRENRAAVTQVLPGLIAPLVGVRVGRIVDGAPNAVVADDSGASVPSYELIAVDVDEHVAAPDDMAAFLPAGEAFDFAVVLVMTWFHGMHKIAFHVHRDDHVRARAALEGLLSRAREADNFYRGKTLQASAVNGHLRLTPIRPARVSRDDLVHAPHVWQEIEANIGGLHRHADVLASAGLGTSRGLLIVGPPGVGKTALCRVIASELPEGTTVVVVDSSIGAHGLARVYEALDLLGPSAVFLNDIDLLSGDRRSHGGNPMLGEFLTKLDGFTPTGSVITVGTTNVLDAIDPALLRAGRFDAVVEIGTPSRAGRLQILRRYLRTFGEFDVDRLAVATEGASGADLREIVRRAVLEHGDALTVDALLDVIGTGRWKVSVSTGQYL